MDFDLFYKIKRKLNITWEDEDTNDRIKDIIEDSKAILIEKLGLSSDFDFSKNGREQMLLKNYVMYEWEDKAELFDENYKNDIAQSRETNCKFCEEDENV